MEPTIRPDSSIDTIAFFEMAPYSRNIINTHRCWDRAAHTKLVAAVKHRRNYLWTGKVVGGVVLPPLVVDWDTVPDVAYGTEKVVVKVKEKDPARWDGGLSCPFCQQAINSTPGRTLHVKSQHPERLQEYHKLLAASIAKPPRAELDDDDDFISRVEESESNAVLSCPFCNNSMTSTAGRTLHVKGKHPDKFEEYRRMDL